MSVRVLVSVYQKVAFVLLTTLIFIKIFIMEKRKSRTCS